MNVHKDDNLLRVAIRMLKPSVAERLLSLLDPLLEPDAPLADRLMLLREMNAGGHGTAFNSIALLIYRLTRDLSDSTSVVERADRIRNLRNLRERLCNVPISNAMLGAPSIAPPVLPHQEKDSLAEAIALVYEVTTGRQPVVAEIEIWRDNLLRGVQFHEFFLNMQKSPEATMHYSRQSLLRDATNGEYVQSAYEILLGRGAASWEVAHWLDRLDTENSSRIEMLSTLFNDAVSLSNAGAASGASDGLSCSIMGTDKNLTAADWQQQAADEAISHSNISRHKEEYPHRFHVRQEPAIRVSALASLYRGGEFIEQFMDNITNQDGFGDYCELVIVDADSPENEYETIRRYEGRHKNIRYIRCNYRIGIYDAWNLAAKVARGEYLTNTNMDDLRRRDSLLIQAGILESLSFVDVVYQDLYYTFNPRLDFESIAGFGHKTSLPIITPHNLMKFNSPHNAPMWRKSLHDDIGYFDTRYKSAGDYDFWMRCLAAGKIFYKINDPHVAYYQNPKGLSTRPDTRGVAEAMSVTKAHARSLLTADVTDSFGEFASRVGMHFSNHPVKESKNRYKLVQQALRNAARQHKFSDKRGV